ncbi:MAG: hypothetical protein HW402_487 [Dehalococcoidales bacterium]|nr:hypothetical protein [Dehalococcoidales bacterium]
MKVSLITVGVVGIVIGSALFVWGQAQIREASGFIGDLERLFSPTSQEMYRTAQTIRTAGVITGIVGIVLFILGISMKSEAKK